MISSFPISNTIRSDRALVSCYQLFQKKRICVCRAKEFDADMYSKSIIDFIAVIILLIVIYITTFTLFCTEWYVSVYGIRINLYSDIIYSIIDIFYLDTMK
jgi:hypothetical protein